MLAALAWGALAASSLLLGGVLGALHAWPTRLTGRLLAFGAGALISAVSFDLAEDGASLAGGLPVGIGLGLGAVVYFLANRWLNRRERVRGSASNAGSGLALGAFLDGIPGASGAGHRDEDRARGKRRTPDRCVLVEPA